MEIDPASPAVVKEFRFYPESEMVTVVFGDDKSEDFTGSENFRKARIAAGASVAPSANLELLDNRGGSVIMIVPQGTPHETFDL